MGMVPSLDLVCSCKPRIGLGGIGENRMMNKMTRGDIRKAIDWYLAKKNIDTNIGIRRSSYTDLDCWGQCYEANGGYMIELAMNQNTRDLLATLFHECVHVWQWERGHWKGEGEQEAIRLQYKLADEYWKAGLV